MRDLLVQLALYGALPVAVVHPVLGVLLFSVITYLRPQELAYGLGDERFLLFSALAVLIGIVHTLGRERLIHVRSETVLMVAFVAWMWVAARQAVFPHLSGYWVESLTKMVFICVLTTGLFATLERVRKLLLVIGFSIGLLACKWAAGGVLGGGVHYEAGPGGAFGDNNAWAIGLAMATALLYAVYETELENKALRLTALAACGGCLLTILFTFSRGGFLTAMVVVGLLMVRSAKSLVLGLVLSSLVVLSLPVLAPDLVDRYLGRIDTIRSFEEDQSANQRLDSWRVALEMAGNYPVFGVGPENFIEVRRGYDGVPLVAHNTPLQILADNGFPGLLLFLALVGTSILRMWWLSRTAKNRYVRSYSRSVMVALLGFMVGSFFVNMAYTELLYHLIAVGVCLVVIDGKGAQAEGVRDRSLGAGDRRPGVAADVEWWRAARSGTS